VTALPRQMMMARMVAGKLHGGRTLAQPPKRCQPTAVTITS